MLACNCSKHQSQKEPIPFSRVLHRRSRRAKYDSKSPSSCTHWGQLKLLVSEIEFLTPFFGESLHVVYAGAAPGVHVPVLAIMFPTMHFILVDPQESMISNGQYPNIEVIAGLMTNTLAAEFASLYSPDLLFISDVRVGSGTPNESGSAQQLRIQRDMDAQRGWLERMCPLKSILKFRLPWIKGETNYLSGRIYLPVYGKRLTHEARLVVTKDAPASNYDNQLYEGQMAYFNQVLRPSIQSAFGGGKCYDCTAFRWIVCKYLAVSAGYELDAVIGYSAIDEKCVWIEHELESYVRLWKST